MSFGRKFDFQPPLPSKFLKKFLAANFFNGPNLLNGPAYFLNSPANLLNGPANSLKSLLSYCAYNYAVMNKQFEFNFLNGLANFLQTVLLSL